MAPIPTINHSGVLPPFLPGTSPSSRGEMAPYKTEFVELSYRFGNTPERREILLGLVAYRRELMSLGFSGGFQWVDGSFLENVELLRRRPPRDVDVVTFAYRPPSHQGTNEWNSLVGSRPDLFVPKEAKRTYSSDAYFVDLSRRASYVVSQTAYWFGLFSHQRDTLLWKGMLEIPIDDDANAIAFLTSGGLRVS